MLLALNSEPLKLPTTCIYILWSIREYVAMANTSFSCVLHVHPTLTVCTVCVSAATVS